MRTTQHQEFHEKLTWWIERRLRAKVRRGISLRSPIAFKEQGAVYIRAACQGVWTCRANVPRGTSPSAYPMPRLPRPTRTATERPAMGRSEPRRVFFRQRSREFSLPKRQRHHRTMQETTSSVELHTVRGNQSGDDRRECASESRVIKVYICMIAMVLPRYQEVWRGVWTRSAATVRFTPPVAGSGPDDAEPS